MSEKKKKRHWPWILRGLLGYVLALLLTVSLVAACAATLADALLTDRALHERVALDDRVIDEQLLRVAEKVLALAKEYSFAPETVQGFVTRESVEDYGREIVAWWMGLMDEEPEMEAPFPDTALLEEAVREDELFRENTRETMRRAIARDSIAYPVGKTLQEAVMPLRTSLISLMMPQVNRRVQLPTLLSLLHMAKLGLYGLSAALLMLVLLTQGRARFLFASAALFAAGLLLLCAAGAVVLVNLPQAMSAYSPLLALQLSVLGEALLPAVAATVGALLLAGLLMQVLYLVTRRWAIARIIAAEA